MLTIGVLGLQGAVREHIRSIEACGAAGLVVKRPEQLNEVDGLILPGGESTTMRRLIDTYHFMDPLREFAAQGKPLFGTCAGLIILAKEIQGSDNAHLGVLNVKVERNSFGRQVDSFEADLTIEGLAEPFTGVFIRAPHILEAGEDVEVLSEHGGRIVAAKQDNLLGCSFHPELTDDHRVTELFVQMVEKHKQEAVV
ncbi:pyridoxal 5'-phosphate synthase glutaminase subunit PdxT [Bacillus atrophaeus]|uniref:Pyridoxal 5'-phosphate synthase subunit PdxT n=1 Tax=Bacillus atrophaeus (strain 1942) TaxID=720555 RepID=A0ABN3ZGK7_BACA1|nr:pyridoxal 5'-phosphate synthase glutaminase subunit PdxT [Bacillus atrophaeus]AMR64477.1 glutamine amidotransferase [Bacillus subtilis subsp. globigii]ADP34651.1 glutamine amidotransferase subunit PdxT [Bacillus atrophaeus 1942]AIK48362.1 pyridoxal 5'-phosphate synthase, glutaminase subunit Pdx2 [Bacillus atrophaeus subsp. globigii]EIM09737.1 glutamine amidotransferase subunit PdxT [Bacillus atrophaeus C89]KFK84417.1 pyridoxal 5'-phosphate synthase, glutaminase subunit Pdx2 [Bacillus atroph